jgi:muskelin
MRISNISHKRGSGRLRSQGDGVQYFRRIRVMCMNDGVDSLGAMPPLVSVGYSIAGSSEPSGGYVAEHILVDHPQDQSSRWSVPALGMRNRPWVLSFKNVGFLLSTVHITDRKIALARPCNMREFEIYAGFTEDNMIEVIHGGLKNDPVPETFHIEDKDAISVCYPTRYVEVVPIL